MKTTKIYTEDKRVNKAINFFINKVAERLLGVGVKVSPDSFYYIDDYICEIRFEVYNPFINESNVVHSRWCLSKDTRRKPQFLTFC